MAGKHAAQGTEINMDRQAEAWEAFVSTWNRHGVVFSIRGDRAELPTLYTSRLEILAAVETEGLHPQVAWAGVNSLSVTF